MIYEMSFYEMLFFAGHSAIKISFVFHGRSQLYWFQKHEVEK